MNGGTIRYTGMYRSTNCPFSSRHKKRRAALAVLVSTGRPGGGAPCRARCAGPGVRRPGASRRQRLSVCREALRFVCRIGPTSRRCGWFRLNVKPPWIHRNLLFLIHPLPPLIRPMPHLSPPAERPRYRASCRTRPFRRSLPQPLRPFRRPLPRPLRPPQLSIRHSYASVPAPS